MLRLALLLVVISSCQIGIAQDRTPQPDSGKADSAARDSVKTPVPNKDAARAVFSGPQVGESLPPFNVTGIFAPYAGKEIDPVKAAGGKPTLIIFFHVLSRPGFGLMNAVNKYAAIRAKDGLQSTVVFLDDDAVERTAWVKRVRRNLPEGPVYTISKEGKEGPGAYGLNHKVHLTVLVGKDNRVTANFALTQPNLPTDGQKILKALVDVLGGGKVPDIQGFSGRGMQKTRMRPNPELVKRLAPLFDEKTKGDALTSAISVVDGYLKQNPAAKSALAQSLPRNRPREIDPLVTAALKRWQSSAEKSRPALNLRPLLQPMIQKDATDAEVDKAAAAVEAFVAKTEGAGKEVGRIATTIVNSDRLANYGTKRCQDILRRWAQKYGAKPAPAADTPPATKPQ